MARKTSLVVGRGKMEPGIQSDFEILSKHDIHGASLNGKNSC